jgi:hypothetical protein
MRRALALEDQTDANLRRAFDNVRADMIAWLFCATRNTTA